MGLGAVVEAVVVAGTVETPYRRAGQGPTVLLLGAGMLFDELRKGLRVIEPLRLPAGADTTPRLPAAAAGAVEPDPAAWQAWLQGLVDGLGLDRPALLVGAELEATVRRAVARDPDRFGPVVPAGPATGALAALAGQAEPPVASSPSERDH